jgi:hypothetical protein
MTAALGQVDPASKARAERMRLLGLPAPELNMKKEHAAKEESGSTGEKAGSARQPRASEYEVTSPTGRTLRAPTGDENGLGYSDVGHEWMHKHSLQAGDLDALAYTASEYYHGHRPPMPVWRVQDTEGIANPIRQSSLARERETIYDVPRRALSPTKGLRSPLQRALEGRRLLRPSRLQPVALAQTSPKGRPLDELAREAVLTSYDDRHREPYHSGYRARARGFYD